MQPVKITIISDLHVMVPELLVNEGTAFEEYLARDRKMLRESVEILDTLVVSILELKPDLVMVTGDLTKDGERVSHELVASQLERLTDAGIQVLVVPGNHDINNPDAKVFDGDTATSTDTITRREFAAIYRHAGYDTRSRRDPDSLSYCRDVTDNLSIAPNFRTNKGDFSDMEVDVALSSQLLNNRLLLNGNFGYRDNTYNTSNTNFIGDFDLEYLLNSKGTFRLKAYNHFNDQNYYLRNALTTQGVGVMWKHDFDKPRHKNRLQLNAPAQDDTIPKRSPAPKENRDSSVRQPVPMVTLRSSQKTE